MISTDQDRVPGDTAVHGASQRIWPCIGREPRNDVGRDVGKIDQVDHGRFRESCTGGPEPGTKRSPHATIPVVSDQHVHSRWHQLARRLGASTKDHDDRVTPTISKRLDGVAKPAVDQGLGPTVPAARSGGEQQADHVPGRSQALSARLPAARPASNIGTGTESAHSFIASRTLRRPSPAGVSS